MINWIKKNKFEFISILSILFLTALFRFYKLDGYMNFLGDEGRDALMVKRILETWDIPLIGPPTSVGNIYLGPMYYYLMTIPMAIFYLNPVAASAMVALFGTATVGLIYFLSRKWFGVISAIISSTLYGFSPVNIIYSKSSWNPNPAPFFSLLSFLGLYMARVKGNYSWLMITGFGLGSVVQMHYLAFILLPIFGILWLYELIEKKEKKLFWSGTIGAVLIFSILISPLVIFDFKHNFLNYRALTELFGGGEAVGFNPLTTINRISYIYDYNLIGRYIAGENPILTTVLSISIMLPLFVSFYLMIRRKKINWPYFTLGVWLILGLMGLSLYKSQLYDHYLGFLNPVPFLLLGSIVALTNKLKGFEKKIIFASVLLVNAFLLIMFIQKSPLNSQPNYQLKRTQEIAKFVIEKSEGNPFNFALIAARNYDSAYQFYLDIYGFKPKQAYEEVTSQMFVVCEDDVCDPTHNQKYEITSFGMSKVDWEEEYMGVRVYKLVSNPTGKP